MNCSKRKKHVCARGGRKSHATLRCCWQGKVLFSIPIKAFKRKGHWLTINLTTMNEVIGAQLFKYVIKAMVATGMNLMPLKAIGREPYFRTRGFFGLTNTSTKMKCSSLA